jgi:hypothetical protein
MQEPMLDLPPRRVLARLAVTLAAALVVEACGASPAPSAASPAPSSTGSPAGGPGRTPSSPAASAPAVPVRSLSPDEQALADAFNALADEHNRAITELMISNPLAEWDLVGVPLAALVAGLPDRLAGLPLAPLTQATVQRLADAVTATGALLSAIDPHGPRVEQAAAYAQALDDWITHVLPLDLELRAHLGLPPPASGDLRL